MAGGKDDRWLFTKAQIENSPSRKCGIDAEKELSYRQQAANYIQDMGQRLQVTQLCINTAIVYMHRFFMFHSFTKFHRNDIASACLFLAAKVEEQPRKLEHVVTVAYRCLHRDLPSLDTKSEKYLKIVQELVFNENILLQALGFDITVDHPHTHVVKTCQLVRGKLKPVKMRVNKYEEFFKKTCGLSVPTGLASKDLAQTSYFLATNSLHLTSMCLAVKPTAVACVAIHLACKWSSWEFPKSKEGKDWWSYVDRSVTLDLLEELTQDFLNIIEKCPSRLKGKIMTWKSEDGVEKLQDQYAVTAVDRPTPRREEKSEERKQRPEPGTSRAQSPAKKPEKPDVGHPSAAVGASNPEMNAGMRRSKSDASLVHSFKDYKEIKARQEAAAAAAQQQHQRNPALGNGHTKPVSHAAGAPHAAGSSRPPPDNPPTMRIKQPIPEVCKSQPDSRKSIPDSRSSQVMQDARMSHSQTMSDMRTSHPVPDARKSQMVPEARKPQPPPDVRRTQLGVDVKTEPGLDVRKPQTLLDRKPQSLPEVPKQRTPEGRTKSKDEQLKSPLLGKERCEVRLERIDSREHPLSKSMKIDSRSDVKSEKRDAKDRLSGGSVKQERPDRALFKDRPDGRQERPPGISIKIEKHGDERSSKTVKTESRVDASESEKPPEREPLLMRLPVLEQLTVEQDRKREKKERERRERHERHERKRLEREREKEREREREKEGLKLKIKIGGHQPEIQQEGGMHRSAGSSDMQRGMNMDMQQSNERRHQHHHHDRNPSIRHSGGPNDLKMKINTSKLQPPPPGASPPPPPPPPPGTDSPGQRRELLGIRINKHDLKQKSGSSRKRAHSPSSGHHSKHSRRDAFSPPKPPSSNMMDRSIQDALGSVHPNGSGDPDPPLPPQDQYLRKQRCQPPLV